MTDLLGETVMVPFPDAEVLTGGTSWSPDRLTFKPCALAAIVIGHPNIAWPVTANSNAAQAVTIRFLRSMMNSFLRDLIARTSDLAKSESEIGIQHDAVTGLP
jgi:hypothetical protein